MISILLAQFIPELKTIADLSFGGAFVWYLVKFLVSLVLAVCAVMVGIKWRKSKNAKKEAEA